MPLLSNNRNHENWPSVVSQDILRHVHQLKNNVYVISGQVKGRTLLPLPVGAEKAAFIESSQARLVLSNLCKLLNILHTIRHIFIMIDHRREMEYGSLSTNCINQGVQNPYKC